MNPRVKIIPITGILDGINGEQLRRSIDTALQAGSRSILIDCTDAEFMDSSGLGALVVALRQVQAQGCRLMLYNLNDQLRMLLKLTDTDQLFEIVVNRETIA